MKRVAEVVAVAAICAVALGLRVFRLDRVPLGILHDEAYNGLDAERILDGARPVFLVANNGREALFMYLQAISVGVFGPTDFALRAVSAVLGFLTVPATYFLVRRLFGIRVALLATAWLALSLWHLIFSRVGLRAISLPLVECLALYCFWGALEVSVGAEPTDVATIDRRRPIARVVSAVFAGAWIGVSLYTYSTARFFPLVVVGLVGYLAILRPTSRRQLWWPLVLSGLTALLVFAPEARFFVLHPTEFVRRADDVSIFNSDLNHGNLIGTAVDALIRNLGMFTVAGDVHWDRNIAFRPVFDPVSSAFLILGLVRALTGWRRPANGLVVLWVFVMLVPGVIAAQNAPDFLRVVGVIPAIFIFPALGLDWLLERLGRLLPRGREPAMAAVLVLGFLLMADQTYAAYFVTWARSPAVAAEFNSDLWEATTLGMRAAQTASAPVYVGAGDSDLPTLAYRFHYAPQDLVYLFNPARSLIFPPGPTATYYFSERQRPSPTALAYLAGPDEIVEALPSGQQVSRYHLISPAEIAPTTRLSARFGDSLEVLGFDVPKEVLAGQPLTVQWYWRMRATDSRTLSFTNQVFDDASHRLGILDDRAFAPDYWPVGTEGISTFVVPLDASATSGVVWLKVAVYDRATMGHLHVFDAQGHPVGDSLRLGPIKLHGKVAPAPRIADPLLTRFADNVNLLGYEVAPSGSNQTQLTLYWSPRGRPAQNYTVFVHALDQTGKLIGQADAPPRNGQYPTSAWDAGETIVDRHVVDVEPSKVSSFAIGLYLPATGQRLPLDGATGNSVTLPNIAH